MKKNNLLIIIQITDTHLFLDMSTTLHGYHTHKLLFEIVEYLIASCFEQLQIIFITGDISEDQSLE